MNKPQEYGKGSRVWFLIVDILIIAILAAFIVSLFLIDKTGGGDLNDADERRLIFSAEVHAPYDKALFMQEGKGEPIALYIDDGEDPFGRLFLGDDGHFYVECRLSSVRASEDMDGVWYLGDQILLSGTVLTVESELADFSITILALPTVELPGAVGTTEEGSESLEPESDPEVESDGTEPSQETDPPESTGTSEESPVTTDAGTDAI